MEIEGGKIKGSNVGTTLRGAFLDNLRRSPAVQSTMEDESQVDTAKPKMSKLSSKLRAMVQIRRKYHMLKTRRADSMSGMLNHSKPEVFTFEEIPVKPSMTKRKKRKKSRVLFPNDSRKYLPVKERNRAKSCLFLLSVIVCFQVYNAIENLDDHLQTYDLEGLEKTMKREVFGQKEAMEDLVNLFSDYFSMYVHNKPLVISINGPSGVGKSHLGRLLARHFRSIMKDELVLQYFMLHHCPLEEDAPQCIQKLEEHIAKAVNQGEAEEKIPVFIFDEVEFMHSDLLDFFRPLFQSNQTNEFLNAVYVFISNIGQAEITKFFLQNSSSNTSVGRHKRQELSKHLKSLLSRYHAMWQEAEIVPFSLLEKSHIKDCFLDEMTREGFYPDSSHIERLASEISYYTVGDKEYSMNGCKQVVGKVNLL
ncbi:TOR4A protein, partial [Polypterus senegalus]